MGLVPLMDKKFAQLIPSLILVLNLRKWELD